MLLLFLLFICLILLGLLADKLLIPVWGWASLLSGSLSFSLLLSGAHWFWCLLIIIPAIAFAFPQVRMRLLVIPWMEKLVLHYGINDHIDGASSDNSDSGIGASNHDLMSSMTMGKEEPQSNRSSGNASNEYSPKTHRTSIAPKELRVVYQYYHLLQNLAVQHNLGHNNNNKLLKKEILKTINKAAALGIDNAYGGEGLSIQARALLLVKVAAIHPQLAEEIATMNCGIQSLLAKYGTSRQKEQILPAIATGEIICQTIDPKLSYHWEAQKTEKVSTNAQGKNIKISGIELLDANAIIHAIKQQDSKQEGNLVAIYVNTQELATSEGVNGINGDTNYNGCWVLLDDKMLAANSESIEESTSTFFIPERFIISGRWDGKVSNEDNPGHHARHNVGTATGTLIETYMQEKAIYKLAIKSAKNLTKSHRSSSYMAALLANNAINDIHHINGLDKTQIASAANQWRDAWLLKQTRDFHLDLHLQEQALPLIDWLICDDKSEAAYIYSTTSSTGISSTTSSTHYLLETNTHWSNIISSARKQAASTEQFNTPSHNPSQNLSQNLSQNPSTDQLMHIDNWLGNFVGNNLRILYLGGLCIAYNCLAFIASIYSKYARHIVAASISPSISPSQTNAVPSSGVQGIRMLGMANNYKLLNATFAVLLDCTAISMIISGKTTNLLPSMASLFYSRAILQSQSGVDLSDINEISEKNAQNTQNIQNTQDTTRMQSNTTNGETPEFLNILCLEAFSKCKQQLVNSLNSLTKDSPSPLSILPLIAKALLSLSPRYKVPSDAEYHQIVNYYSIPSQQRNAFFAEIETASPRLQEMEELVKVAWLVKEIYDSLEGKGYASLDVRSKHLTTKQWYDELLKAHLINNDDIKILNDFNKKFALMSYSQG